MLLDEVTSALDPELVGEVLAAVRELKAEGVTMLLATHEMSFAREVADTVGFLHDGRLIELGPAEQVLDEPRRSPRRSGSCAACWRGIGPSYEPASARTKSMKARAAGETWRRSRQSRATGRWTGGRRRRTSIGGPSRRVSERGMTPAPKPTETRLRSRNGSPLSSETVSGSPAAAM